MLIGNKFRNAIFLNLTQILIFQQNVLQEHCVKSVQIESYFWSVFSCIRSEYRKIRTKNNSVFGHVLRSDRETPLFLSKAFVTMNLLISFLTGSDFTRYSMEHLFFRSKILTHGRAGSCFSFSNIIF